MYERNAIVLERHFAKLFGYDEKNNLKNNYSNFVELVERIEKYQEAVKNEDEIIAEYDQIIKKIKDVQNKQEALSNKNTKLQENRNRQLPIYRRVMRSNCAKQKLYNPNY